MSAKRVNQAEEGDTQREKPNLRGEEEEGMDERKRIREWLVGS